MILYALLKKSGFSLAGLLRKGILHTTNMIHNQCIPGLQREFQCSTQATLCKSCSQIHLHSQHRSLHSQVSFLEPWLNNFQGASTMMSLLGGFGCGTLSHSDSLLFYSKSFYLSLLPALLINEKVLFIQDFSTNRLIFACVNYIPSSSNLASFKGDKKGTEEPVTFCFTSFLDC